MDELELLGPQGDGEHLVLTNSQGVRFVLRINDDLRSAVRRDAPRFDSLKATAGQDLGPRQLQTMIRAGMKADEIADSYHIDIERVRRFEGPVLNERRWISERARNASIGSTSDSPRLGDLVIDRLAARGVDPLTLRWDAVRHPGESWEIHLRFIQEAQERFARWSFDPTSDSVRAADEESRWLSETVSPTRPTSNAAVHRLRSSFLRTETPDEETVDKTASILDGLSKARGIREEVVLELDDEELPSTLSQAPAQNEQAPSGEVISLHPAHESHLEVPTEHNDGQTDLGPRRSRKKLRRQSVPTWDEIVFGAKSD